MGRARKPAAAVKKNPRQRARPAGKPAAPLLRPVPLYEFAVGGLVGQARLDDPGRGIAFLGTAEGKSLPAASHEVLSLRHYLCRGTGGLLTPREECGCEGKAEKQGVVFRYEKAKGWPVEASARYDLLEQGGVDASLSFSFGKGLRGFEAGIETLMPRGQPVAYVHSGGTWARALAGPQGLRFYPRNARAAELIADGRWDEVRLAGLSLRVEPQGYDYPMILVRDERTRWALAYMALTDECSSVWVNGAQRAVGLSMLGSDVKARSSLTCRLRVALCQAEELDDALPHYRTFVQEARAARR